MTERKFHIPAIILGAAGMLLQFFAFPVGGLAAGIAGLVLSVIKRTSHRTLLPLVLSVFAILGGVMWFVIWSINGDHSYWLYSISGS